ncbi:MAG: NAD(P)H-hydrate dehydratase [Oscillospiraceae bacterium]|nr:NAD(P)H-hydrate dehydratase [Oscillospiraceae bacterium]
MKLVTAQQMRDIDRTATEKFGISGVTLMSNAAEHLAKTAMEHITVDGCAAVFCGTGNNGGDGIGAAAYLLERGVSVRTILIGDERKLTPDAAQMHKRLVEHGGSLERYSLSADLVDYVSDCSVIIDAIFGIGLSSDLQNEVLSAVTMINSSPALIIAADIPSGVHADTGRVFKDAVKADITVTFSLAKPGHFVEPGCIYCGELLVKDIGIPRSVLDSTVSHTYATISTDVNLPRRRRNTHKGDYGRALIIAGSVGYTGAPALSARAASKMGTGLVSVGVPKTIYDILAIKLDEEMPFPLPSDNKGRLASNAASDILKRAKKSDVCLIGPGLGTSDDITELVQSLTHISETPVILDADGLNAVSSNIDTLNQITCPLILTPHPGEFERLGGKIDGDRLRSARDFASKYGCILVLKGHRTIIALPNGITYINTTGGPAMAKGGTGDVLAGMITALIAQRLPIVHAVIKAVYIHGLAGDMCADEFGEYSVTASDIIAMLPAAIKEIEAI